MKSNITVCAYYKQVGHNFGNTAVELFVYFFSGPLINTNVVPFNFTGEIVEFSTAADRELCSSRQSNLDRGIGK